MMSGVKLCGGRIDVCACGGGVQFRMIDAAAAAAAVPPKVLVFPHSRHAIKNFSYHVLAGAVQIMNFRIPESFV